ncbi:MAG: NAD(P)H-hydrate dehydratase [Salinivirgaceae bacterium]|nr:NAD(P)H-hydrate dehydratase [Salinivirgaceae bacterium]
MMCKILTSKEIREVDAYTIVNEPIASIDLMERAALSLLKEIRCLFPGHKQFVIFAGPGNNGGDAVALYRLMSVEDFNAQLYVVNEGRKYSTDCSTNLQKLDTLNIPYIHLGSIQDIIPFDSEFIVIDGIFGSGLSRFVQGFYLEVVNYINNLDNTVVSIDMPTGLVDANNSENRGAIVMANYTLTLQVPKLSLMFSENELFVGEFRIVDINLHLEGLQKAKTNYYLLQNQDLKLLLKKRSDFSYKGTFGHALIIAGSQGKYGAALLSSKACLRSGAGLVSLLSVEANNRQMDSIIHNSFPEAMILPFESLFVDEVAMKFSIIAIGPGIGLSKDVETRFEGILKTLKCPFVLDADAITILSRRSDLLEIIPENSIITPHVGEFDRLVGPSSNSFERLQKAILFSIKHKVITVLKGANTAIVDTNGVVWFSNSGNPGMATAGSGDVLTGMIAGIRSSGYSALQSAQMGVWLHGMAGMQALGKQSFESLIASDIIENIGGAFKSLTQ